MYAIIMLKILFCEVLYNGFFLFMIGAIAGTSEGICIKKYNAKHEKGSFLFLALISLFSILFFAFADKNGLTFVPRIFPYAIVAGILYCGSSFLTYIALGCGSFAISYLVLSYSIVFGIGYGLIFLKETASVFTYIGFALIMATLYLIRGKSEEKTTVSFKWVICIGGSVLGSGLYSIVQRIQQLRFDNAYTNEFMVISLGFSALVLIIVGIIIYGKHIKETARYGTPYAITAGISNGIANFMRLILNNIMAFSIVSPITAGLKTIFSFIISKVVFKETFLKRQVVGVLLGVLAIIFLNL